MQVDRTPPLPYLLRQVRVGVVATALVVVALGFAYFVLGVDRADRASLAAILVVAAAGGVVAAVLPWPRILARTGMRLLYVWSLTDIVLITAAIVATGGGRSEVFVLYTLTTFFFVASYPVLMQVALFVFTVACYVLAIAVTGWEVTAGELVTRLSVLGVLAYLAGYLSKELLERVEAESASRREADGRAALLTVVATAGRDMTLDPTHVAEVVVEAVVGLGFPDAAFVALREDGAVDGVVAGRGSFGTSGGDDHPAVGAAGVVVAQGETVVIEEDQVSVATLVGAPVWVGGWLGAVLVGRVPAAGNGTRHRLEAFEILATNAGLALDNAGRYEEQRQTVERLEEAERLKADFLTSVSHELRSPLTSILGNAATLDRSWNELDDETRRSLLQGLTSGARELEGKLTDLIDVAGSERATTASFRQVDVSALLHSVVYQARDAFGERRLTVDVQPGLAAMGDPVLLSQVVRVLLDNAATHTPAGTAVTMTAVLEGDSEIVVSVRDDGPGIAEQDLPYLGVRFFRGGDLVGRPRGLGLGLAIAGSALELHGSALEIDSAEGQGARFAFRLAALRTPARANAREIVAGDAP